jgi:ATP-dependent DNA helicase DinG
VSPDDLSLRRLLRSAVKAVGGVERPGQVAMAEAVAAAIESEEHLLVQAGTGTGKSLAYLVPAIRHAMSGDDPVVVATATIALQGQLVDRDLPRLADALERHFERRVDFAILKGRANYLCLHRVRDGVPNEQGVLVDVPPTTPLGREVRRLREWAGTTGTGDRDEAPAAAERAWAQVSVSGRECLGNRCAYQRECFAEKARDRARKADVVVTNHTLLAIDALDDVPVLPDHGVVIVDEAHELVSRVTSAATQEIAPAMVERAAGRSRRHIDARLAEVLDFAGDELGKALAEASVGEIRELAGPLRAALVAVRDAAHEAVGGFAGEREASDSEDEAARRQARALVEDAFAVAARLVELSPDDVAWVTDRDRGGKIIRVAPLSVAGLLRDALFAERTVVLTSATLQLGGEFGIVAREMGLEPGPAGGGAEDDDHRPAWRGLDVGSPFDYRRQGILYVAGHLPRPSLGGISSAAIDELADLITAAGGRTLALFASTRNTEAAVAALRERLDVPILCQGDEPLVELVRRFAADARACLFGTVSLWQGVDVPGSACQLVVIDKLPFPPPDDPMVAARSRAADRAGGNGFMSVSAAHTALLLAQGSGRLIRSLDDRGVVAVLDPRLATARYAGFLRASLPSFWFTTDPAQVRRSLAAIDASAPPPLPVLRRPARAGSGKSDLSVPSG